MKPFVIAALTAAGLLGTSSMAGERPMSFDGVGSMVLDMADEAETASFEGGESDTNDEECSARNEAFEAQVEALREDIKYRIELGEQAFAKVDMAKFEKFSEAIAVEIAELPMNFTFVEAEHAEAAVAARKVALASAKASIQARRDELKERIAVIGNGHSRIALERAEKALRLAQEALIE
ncbi:hypothetical protein [Kordiimonas gwangyangensis]|uniref:hypothetical protein n=1 Tax=Kordiimonas gwangyangensis TaxID=288022 RepID=UPI0003A7853A|nr:hypothetical protein [Kordiimonas gwangyangensis]